MSECATSGEESVATIQRLDTMSEWATGARSSVAVKTTSTVACSK